MAYKMKGWSGWYNSPLKDEPETRYYHNHGPNEEHGNEDTPVKHSEEAHKAEHSKDATKSIIEKIKGYKFKEIGTTTKKDK